MTCIKDITKEVVAGKLAARSKDANKGDFGKLLIVAGSQGMTGAAVLCAGGALRAGAGTVTVSIAPHLFPILQVAVPEAMCIERSEGVDLNGYDALVIGPGLGWNPKDEDIMKLILRDYKGPLVMDADGLNNIGRLDLVSLVAGWEGQLIITPHPGEAAGLLKAAGRDCNPIKSNRVEDRIKVARELSEVYKCITVLKGSGTLVCNEKSVLMRNTTGNPGMATGGSGDVLAGIIGALTAQGYPPLQAAEIGVYVHGLTGDLAAKERGEISMTAGDLVKYLHWGFQNLWK